MQLNNSADTFIMQNKAHLQMYAPRYLETDTSLNEGEHPSNKEKSTVLDEEMAEQAQKCIIL